MTDATSGMRSGGYYDAHSTFQADTAASVANLLEQATAALTLPKGGAVTVADYGCSEGRNSMATVGAALKLLAARGARSLCVLHSDLPTNDWQGLAANLAGAASYLRSFPEARALFAPRASSERVTQPASVTLGLRLGCPLAVAAAARPRHADHALPPDAPPAELAKILAQAAGTGRRSSPRGRKR